MQLSPIKFTTEKVCNSFIKWKVSFVAGKVCNICRNGRYSLVPNCRRVGERRGGGFKLQVLRKQLVKFI